MVMFVHGNVWLVVSRLHHGWVMYCMLYNWVSISSHSLQLDLSLLTLELYSGQNDEKIANTRRPGPV